MVPHIARNPAAELRSVAAVGTVDARTKRRLVVNADDFGLSSGVNAAVIEAHREGILTTASLMVNEAAFEEAVEFARDNPSMGVGLHLTLCQGRSTLTGQRALVDGEGKFAASPVWTGLKYFFSHTAREYLALEIAAQVNKFQATGLRMDHVNGHLNFHVHPTVFGILLPILRELGPVGFRIPSEPARPGFSLGRGRLGYRWSHWLIFQALSARARSRLGEAVLVTRQVFGLLESGRVTREYVMRLLGKLPEGNSELYLHPSIEEFRHELDALTSQEVRDEVRRQGIELVKYSDL